MLYDYPEYYEIAFSERDVHIEADFICACIERYSRAPVKRVLEIACGPAPHAEELVRRGYRYIGLDINRTMLDYAAYKWRHLNPPPELIEGNMVKFDYPKGADFAFVMLGSLYLDSLNEMTSHFDCMARVLKPGALYFLDWCIEFNDPLTSRVVSTLTNERNGVAVQSHFNIRLIDPALQMYEEIWTVDVNDHGRHRRFKMVERNRAIFPQEFLLFLESRTDFEFVGWWHDWDFAKPIGGEALVSRPVALIRRK